LIDQPTWDLVADIQLLLRFHFMQNALLTGTLVALPAGLIGYFVVLRGQSFATHTLSQVGFPGAAAGVLVHASPVLGLVAFCGAAALGIGLSGGGTAAGRRQESATVGSILAFSLALGLLFVRLYSGSAQGIYAFLFGSILGISDRDVFATALASALAVGVMAVMGRPLLFATVDPDAAEARGVPVRALGIAFLLVVALSVAVAVQVVGTLLVFALLVTPGAVALRLSSRPLTALALTTGLALAFVWLGLSVAYFTLLPVGFVVTTLSFLAYGAARVSTS
jgi:zinc/manganese transport system permease protein